MKRISVPGRLDALGPIREFVKSAAQEAGLEKKRAYSLQLAVDEIATNIVVHGYQAAGLEGDLEVVAEIDDQTLTIAIEDAAIPFDPLAQPSPDDLDAPLEDRDIGGLGVFIAIGNVDSFRYEFVDGHNRNIFVMNRE